MILDEFIEQNFKKLDNIYYGSYKDYNMTIQEVISKVVISISFIKPIDNQIGKSISTEMTKIKERYRPLLNAITTNICLELTLYRGSDLDDCFESIIEETINNLNNSLRNDLKICPICQQELDGNIKSIIIRNNYIVAHEKCVEEITKTTGQFISDNKQKSYEKFYLIGILSILLYLSLSALISYLTQSIFMILVTGFFFLTTSRFFAFKMKLLSLKKGAKILGICSIIGTVLSIISCSLFAYLSINPGVEFSNLFVKFFEFMKINFDGFTKPIIVDSALALIYSILNFILSMKKFDMFQNPIKIIKE